MKLISKKDSVLFLQCTKPEDYKNMLDVIDIDWFLSLTSNSKRQFFQKIKKGQFRITVALAKRQGLYFEESGVEFILSSSDVELLRYLETEKGYTTRELSKKYKKPVSTLASKMGRFRSYGFVKRNAKETNGSRGRTRVDYTLTDKGMRYQNELRSNE